MLLSLPRMEHQSSALIGLTKQALSLRYVFIFGAFPDDYRTSLNHLTVQPLKVAIGHQVPLETCAAMQHPVVIEDKHRAG